MTVTDITIIVSVLIVVVLIFTVLNKESFIKEKELRDLKQTQDKYMNKFQRENDPKLKMYYEIKINNLQTQIKEMERKTS